MSQMAAVFRSGGSQAVRLPAAFRFSTDRVYIRRDRSGDVVLSTNPGTWDGFIDALAGLDVPTDFLASESRQATERDLFGGIA